MKKTFTKTALLVLSILLSTGFSNIELKTYSMNEEVTSEENFSDLDFISSESKMKKMLANMFELYINSNSSDPKFTPSKKAKIKEKSAEVFKKYKNKIDKDELNVVKHLYFFLDEAASLRGAPNSNLCCYHLSSTLCFYSKMVYPNDYPNYYVKQVLADNYGITEDFLEKIYSTWLPQRFHFIKGEFCLNENGKPQEKQSICLEVLGCTDSTATNYNPNATTNNGSCVYSSKQEFEPIEVKIPNATMIVTPEKTVVHFDDGGGSISASDPFSMLEKLVFRDLFRDGKIKLTEPIPNDPRLEEFFRKYGIPLELSINDLRGSILFPLGEYFIDNNTRKQFYDSYVEGLTSFKNSIGTICYTFGGSNFIIVVQGSADSLKIKSPKCLKEGYNDSVYSQMDITYPVQDTIFIKKHILEDQEYNNIPLPNLRGTFMGQMIGKYGVMSKGKRKNQIFVLDGIITDRASPEDRNASFLIYINIEEGKKYFLEHKDEIFGKK